MSDIMNRSDVLDTVAAECDLPSAKVDAVLKSFESAIGRTLSQGGEVRIAGFGTFKTSARAARTSRNPRTGEPVQVPARTAARFVPGTGLKTAAEGASGEGAKTSGTKTAPARADSKAAAGQTTAEAPAKATKAKAGAKSETKAASAKAEDSKKSGAKAEKAPAKKKK